MFAELIVGGALFRVLEGVVGFGNFLEFGFAVRFLGDVGMILACQLALRFLDGGIIGRSLDAQNAVVVFVFHELARFNYDANPAYATGEGLDICI